MATSFPFLDEAVIMMIIDLHSLLFFSFADFDSSSLEVFIQYSGCMNGRRYAQSLEWPFDP